ncbi:integrase catalytic domain-containing protein [Trichonephila clavipes]|nr:integrase catalytic domain-containing protein [Trichonephila clavipes]
MLKKSNVLHGPLTSEELSEAEIFWIQVEQEKFFPEGLKSLKDNKIEKESPLYNYMPYLDENGLIRLGGRLEFCNLSIDEKHPFILPKNSWLTTMIIRKKHIKVMRSQYIGTTKPTDQLTSPLPSDRINQMPAFSVCGLDFARPLFVNNFGELQKCYIVLFTCGVTRALPLELVSPNSFLLALRRFFARTGSCIVIYSDNAKTFLKSKKQIENLSSILSQSMVQNFIAKERIIWKNIIERSPWWEDFMNVWLSDTKKWKEMMKYGVILVPAQLRDQSEFVTNSSDVWGNISIKDFTPISHSAQSCSMDHRQVSVAIARDLCTNYDSTTSVIVSFNIVGLVVSEVLFPPDQKTS